MIIHTLLRCIQQSPEDIVEGHISTAVKSLHLIAHVLKQQLVLVQIHFQPSSEQTKQELHPGCWDHALERQPQRVSDRDNGMTQEVSDNLMCISKL